MCLRLEHGTDHAWLAVLQAGVTTQPHFARMVQRRTVTRRGPGSDDGATLLQSEQE